ncbi:MAG: hypothetical protein HKN34_07805, partial [Gammaproteobacteria bacterium]|nr:hypothetical protein [Gammaproteobacteria bacterium]
LIIAPFANAEASASAAATIFIGSAGVEGVLTLLEEKLNIVSGASINVDDGLHPENPPADFITSEIIIVPRLRVINELTGARGAVNLFVEVSVPTVVECSWGFVTGFCPGLSKSKYPFNIANYTAWKKVDTLLDISSTIDIVTLGDGTVNYYQ